ncbi:hypothetical protein ACF0H5_023192 [Mactra antiquata]
MAVILLLVTCFLGQIVQTGCDTDYYIAHCKYRRKQCGGTPDGIKCTDCDDPFYSAGYNKGCLECPRIDHCTTRHCTTPSNTRCSKCEGKANNVLFKVSRDHTACDRMCSHQYDYCWPGTCGSDLTKNCQCANGFTRVSTDAQTTCQPNISPEIETCGTVVTGPNGEKVQALSSTSSTECKNLQDMYGNFQLVQLTFDMLSSFTLPKPNDTKPRFIEEHNFGVTDTSVYIEEISMNGSRSRLSSHQQLVDSSRSTSANATFASNANITINHGLNNGETLCFVYEAFGGGYLKSINVMSSNIVSAAIPYNKTKQTQQVCYRYDSSKPEHCKEKGSCGKEPLVVAHPITSSPLQTVYFEGWFDPVPAGGKVIQASQIESYEIRVNEVNPSSDLSTVDYTKNLFVNKTTADVNDMILNLTSNSPRLYCISLEVTDVAKNPRQARRFILYDNTTFIESRNDRPFIVSSASSQTEFKWQTHHHDICLSWKGHFFNRYYLDNKLLNPIAPEANGLIQGVYEQFQAPLSVNGTPNVDGITSFMFSWSVDGGSMSYEIAVPEFLNQTFCKDLGVKDGEVYTIQIRPIDIVGHTYSENRTVCIDRSAPHINNIWLTKDGYHTLFVHDSRDISRMVLTFETIDPHSGISSIKYNFGVSDGSIDLTTGLLAVNKLTNSTCPPDAKCYCSDIGSCEMYNYSIPLNKLVNAGKHEGNHNRNYFFTIKVTNNAMLSNIEHVDILVDDSPPEVGVVYEGSESSPDIDYTSDDSFIVHWKGFIDHESGIKVYRIGLATRCLGQKELYNFTNIDDIEYYEEVPFTELSTRVPANFTGKMFITVVALNNAMDPSQPVCTDGITRDISPPYIRNLTLDYASWRESIACHERTSWLLKSSLSKISLQNISQCSQKCTNVSTNYTMIDALPSIKDNTRDVDVDEFLCKNLPLYDNSMIIYVPNNRLNLHWDIDEAGSQVSDYFVGFGTDPTEVDSPSISSYKSTNRKTSFQKRHIGIGSNEIFYIFVKVVNKAGLERIYDFGPVLVDETPPIHNYIPKVIIDEDKITVGWENDTFYDMEQTEQISSVFFQIGHGDVHVSPLLQWHLYSSETCPDFSGGCFHYPLRRLQTQDTDNRLQFYIDLHVFNAAGHSITIRTDRFQLPSRYPPGHAVVMDTDPLLPNNYIDVDYHFTPNTICAYWQGFKHHQDVKIEMGIGTNVTTDDIVKFSLVNSSDYHCISSPNIKNDVKYFSLLKATCSGGSTVSHSSGVVILDNLLLIDSLKVWPGANCDKLSEKVTINSMMKNTRNNTDGYSFQLNTTLAIGKRYVLIVNNESMTSIASDDGMLSPFVNEHSHNIVFVPYMEHPTFHTNMIEGEVLNQQIRIAECPNKHSMKEHEAITAYWENTGEKHEGIKHEIAIVKIPVDESNATKLLEYVTAFEAVPDGQSEYTFNEVNLKPGFNYKIAVKQCSSARCINQSLSDVFTVEVIPYITVKSAKLLSTNSTCALTEIRWNVSVFDDTMLFYQWAISRDDRVTNIVSQWQTLDTTYTLQVSSCIEIPLHLHSTMYGCIRGFTQAGDMIYDCQTLSYQSSDHKLDVVYDLDSSNKEWDILKQAITSSNIGTILKTLHDSELDFGTTNTTVVGAMLQASERSVTWFLMQKRHVPLDCDTDPNCVISMVTNTGYVPIARSDIVYGTIYYICASAKSVDVVRELFVDTLPEVHTCSNGFVLDNKQPVGGSIHVTNTDGFLTNTKKLEVSWDQFSDDVQATKFGYSDNIEEYSLAVGSKPGRDDIIRYHDVGLHRYSTVDIRNVSDGSVVYISVKGFDHAGLSDTVSSQDFVVDTTGPTTGDIIIDTTNHLSKDYLTSNEMTVRFAGFIDDHSGISHYRLGVGSQPFTTDVISLFDWYDNSFSLDFTNVNLIDGHDYFVFVQAVNRAGLKSTALTKSFRVDRSPPNGGHVLDGPISEKKDIDFQADLNTIFGHWKGFSDIHSGLEYYKVGLGTRPYKDNVFGKVDVGLNMDMQWHGTFDIGTKYYIIVEACNKAGLCIQRTSDGVTIDNSPPIQGMVRVGSTDQHHKYLPHRSVAHVHWVGFNDPHSGIKNYKMCIGTVPGQCDQLPYTDCLLRSNIIKTGLNLPVNIDLYATVVAHNQAGLNISQISDSFRIDETSPNVVRRPAFILDRLHGGKNNVQWEKSILKIDWKFNDAESPIVSHEITLKTHHEGHTPIEHIKLGAETNISINLDGKSWLNDGDKYIAVITSCNMAGLCTSNTTGDLLIDSTTPHTGGFKPPLNWRDIAITNDTTTAEIILTWYGFYDHESGIDKYFLTASRSYSGHELSDGIIAVDADLNKLEQNTTLKLSEKLSPDDQVVLTIWAMNSVGLNSSIAKISVNVIQTVISKTVDPRKVHGILEIEKHSCDVHYCNKDCTCALFGKPCSHLDTNTTCTALNTSDSSVPLPHVNVYTGLHRQNNEVTSSSACLTGSWGIEDLGNSSQAVLRYEWSMGIYQQPIGEGIFDLKTEIPWKDVGLQEHVIHCLPVNKSLTHGEKYVVYTRVWFSADTYAEYTSTPIIVDQTAPSIRKGQTIKVSDITCTKDFDVIDWNDTITACWKDVFSEQQSQITHYTLKMGTSRNADDILPLTNVGLSTSYTMTNLSLSQDTKYFFTVTAYNNVGFYSVTTSDGFIVDITSPVSGAVFNSNNYKNLAYQSSNNTMTVSFQGFQDDSSGIRYFMAAIANNTQLASFIKPFANVGLTTQYTFNDLELVQGGTYYKAVKSVDNANHWSETVVSRGIIVDTTPPIGVACRKYETINFNSTISTSKTEMSSVIHANLSRGIPYTIFGSFNVSIDMVNVRLYLESHIESMPLIQNHDNSLGIDYNFIPSSNIDSVKLSIEGVNVTEPILDLQVCTNVIEDNDGAVIVRQVSSKMFAVYVPVVDQESHVNKVEIGAGTTPGGFQVQPLTTIHNAYINSIIKGHVPHGSTLHVTVVAENRAGLRSVFYSKPLMVDLTPPVLHDVSVQQRINTTTLENATDPVIILETDWITNDYESGVKYCFCQIGSKPGLSNIQTKWRTQTDASCTSDNLFLNHGQRVYVTVRCVNEIQLFVTTSSTPVSISFQKPGVDSAEVDVVPLNQISPVYTPTLNTALSVQSNKSCIELKWSKFHDLSDIEFYEYRVTQNGATIVDWTRCIKPYMTMNCNVMMGDGRYMAEVRAVNTGGYISDSVSTQFVVASTDPKLTGHPISFTRNHQHLTMDWSNVFNTQSDVPVLFGVLVGSRPGFEDIKDIQYTSGHALNISIPESTIITPHIQELFVRVECMYSTGLYTAYRSNYMFY